MTKPAYEYNVYSAKDFYDDTLPDNVIAVARFVVTEENGQWCSGYYDDTQSLRFIYAPVVWDAEWYDTFYYDTDPELPWFVPLLDFDFGKETTR